MAIARTNIPPTQISRDALLRDPALSWSGEVLSVSTLGVEISDKFGVLDLGARVSLSPREPDRVAGEVGQTDQIGQSGAPLWAEIVALGENSARAMAYGSLAGVRRGDIAHFSSHGQACTPSAGWLGRVVDALGQPIDGKGPLPQGDQAMALRASPPPAALRARLGARVDFGVKAMNAFTPAQAGQRLGIFSGSGVGKSALLGMLAQHTECDVRIIALIGERGREVRDFIENDLGPEGLAKSILVVATADQPALMRREAGFMAMTLAEYFRDQGQHVVCMMDSLTRIAMAQREIGLAAGEPPAARGFTPSVFSLLPSLLERAGPGLEQGGLEQVGLEPGGKSAGMITGLFSVLVEGDDPDEPVADHCRAILDGHIVLDRAIAERGRYPAINILKSLSRTAGDLFTADEAAHYTSARQKAALYTDMADMIKIGAYQPGANAEIDDAVDFWARLEEFLTQNRHDCLRRDDHAASLTSLFEA